MAEQPIKGSQIIEDGALDDHINDLNKIIEEYKEWDKQAKKTATSVKTLSNKLSANKAGDLKEAINQQKLLTATLKEQERQKVISAQSEIKLQTLTAKKIALDKKAQQAELTSNKLYAEKSRKLTNLRRDYKELALTEGASEKAKRKLRKEVISLDKELKKLDASVGQNQRSVGNYSKALNGLKGGLARLGIGFAVFQGLKNSLSTITDFQQGSANLASVLGKTRDEIKALTADAKRLGSTTVFTASQVLKLQTAFSKLGFDESEILNATEATLQLAAATGTELEEAATVAAQTLNGFGLDASETQRVVDVMAKSFTSSALDMSKFSSAMSNVAPIAKQANFTVERTTAILGKLVDTGVDASKAGTDLRTIFVKLSKTGLTFEQAMEKIQKSTNKTKTAVELFDVRAASSAVTLSENTKELNELDEALQNAGGSAEEMADTQLDTLTGSTTRLTSAWEGFILSLEDGDGVIARVIRGAIDLTTTLLDRLTELTSTQAQNESRRGANISDSVGRLQVDRQKRINELLKKSNAELKSIAKGDDKLAKSAKDVLKFLDLGYSSAQVKAEVLGKIATDASNELKKVQEELNKPENRIAGVVSFTDLEKQDKALKTIREENIELLQNELKLMSEKELIDLKSDFFRKDTSKNQKIVSRFAQNELTRRKELLEREGEITEETTKQADGYKSIKKELTGIDLLKKREKEAQKLLNDELVNNLGAENDKTELLREQLDILDLQIKKYEFFSEKGGGEIAEFGRVQGKRAGSIDNGSEPLGLQTPEDVKDESEEIITTIEERDAALASLAQTSTDMTLYFTEKRIEALDRENEAEQRKYDNATARIEQLNAMRDAEGANIEESLAYEKKAQAEALAEQERIAKKKQRLELINASLTAFNSQVQQGVNNPAGGTIAQLSTLLTYISSLPAFWTGTDTTVGDSLGTKIHNGRDGILAKVDKDEIILNKEKSDKLMSAGLNTDQITKYALAYQNGMNTMEVSSVTALPVFESNKKELQEMQTTLQQIARKPTSQFSIETLGNITKLIEKEYKHNATNTRVQHKRLGR